MHRGHITFQTGNRKVQSKIQVEEAPVDAEAMKRMPGKSGLRPNESAVAQTCRRNSIAL